jgi:hypothetical protein
MKLPPKPIVWLKRFACAICGERHRTENHEAAKRQDKVISFWDTRERTP